MEAKIDRIQPYQRNVEEQTRRNPSLSQLASFLSSRSVEQHACRIFCLRFANQRDAPVVEQISPGNLKQHLRMTRKRLDVEYHGCLYIVEDLSRQVVEDLGDAMDLDPFFFASHLYAAEGLTSARAPPNSLLPSQKRHQNFATILYHRIIQVNVAPGPRKMRRSMNVPRRTTFLPAIENLQLALVQHAYSIAKSICSNGSWKCVVLVDSPLTTYTKLRTHGQSDSSSVTLKTELFQGGYEDFPSSHREETAHGSRPQKQGLLDDLLFYWRQGPPDHFVIGNPSLVQLSYFALRIISAEWVNYETLMNITARDLEYTIPDVPDPGVEMEKLNQNLKSLQSWQRRSKATQIKIKSAIHLVKRENRDGEPWNSLLEDYQHLSENMLDYGERLARMLPMVASFVQIIDARRSLAETTNISRLTILALVFVPLTFVTGVFSMNPKFGPGGAHFWLYFAVALPMTIVMFCVARSRLPDIRPLLSRTRHAINDSPQIV